MGSPPAAMLDEWTRLERRTGLLPSLLAARSFRTGTDTRAPDAGLRLRLWVSASFQRRRCYLYLVLTYAGDFP